MTPDEIRLRLEPVAFRAWLQKLGRDEAGECREVCGCLLARFLRDRGTGGVWIGRDQFGVDHIESLFLLPNWARWFVKLVDDWGEEAGKKAIPASVALALLAQAMEQPF